MVASSNGFTDQAYYRQHQENRPGNDDAVSTPPAPTDESGAPVDRYANVTIDLPPGLTSGSALDPAAADGSLAGNPFAGQLNLGNTFGAYVGSQTGEQGTSDDPTSPYDLAQRAAQTQRGDSFDINNPLGALGSSQAQVNQTIPGGWGQPARNPLATNWQGDLTNQQTNDTAPSQIRPANLIDGPTPLDTATTPPNLEAAEIPTALKGPGTTTGPQLPQGKPLPEKPQQGPKTTVNVGQQIESIQQRISNLDQQIQQLESTLARLQEELKAAEGYFNFLYSHREPGNIRQEIASTEKLIASLKAERQQLATLLEAYQASQQAGNSQISSDELARYQEFNQLFKQWQQLVGYGDGSLAFPYDVFQSWTPEEQQQAILRARDELDAARKAFNNWLNGPSGSSIRPMTPREQGYYDLQNRFAGEDLTDPAVAFAYRQQLLRMYGHDALARIELGHFITETLIMPFVGLPSLGPRQYNLKIVEKAWGAPLAPEIHPGHTGRAPGSAGRGFSTALESGNGTESQTPAPLFKTWNEFQAGTKGQFTNRAEAAKAWAAYKQANNIVTGTARNSVAKRNFLKGLANDPNTPSWMKPWLQKGKVPPGYEIDHIIPLSVGGADDAPNMRLQLIELHKIHHKYYRPWE